MVIFIANAFSHIFIPLCDALSEHYGSDFKFIATKELANNRKEIGSAEERSYVIHSKDDETATKKLCDEADVVIFGYADLEYIENRIKNNKLTIYYSERLFKQRLLRYLNPITLWRLKKRFIDPSKNSNFHLICASSFAALDFKRVGAFKNKMYKWGYQTAVFEKDIDKVMASKAEDGLDFIWVGRLVALKHCDDAIRVISNLRKMGYKARLKVVGAGEEEANLKAMVSSLDLEDNVMFKGACKIEDTRKMMDEANIFLFTSDFGEGWGATLNECMNSGVACVASHGAGSTNFLTKDGENALVYVSGDVQMLTEKAKLLVDNKELREKIGKNAYKDIYENWNAKTSYKRMIQFINELKEKGTCELFEDGPCSKAEPLSHNWYK